MNEIEVIQNIPQSLFDAEGNTAPTRILVRGGEVSALAQDYRSRPGDVVYDYSKQNGSITLTAADVSGYEPEASSAEAWLIRKGYGPMQLVALLDMEGRLQTAQKSSAKMTAVRTWIDTITAAFLLGQAQRTDWPEPPHQFEETLLEAGEALAI